MSLRPTPLGNFGSTWPGWPSPRPPISNRLGSAAVPIQGACWSSTTCPRAASAAGATWPAAATGPRPPRTSGVTVVRAAARSRSPRSPRSRASGRHTARSSNGSGHDRVSHNRRRTAPLARISRGMSRGLAPGLLALAHRLLEVVVRQDAFVGIGRAWPGGREVELLHVRRGLPPPGVEELLGVVRPGVGHRPPVGHHILHEVECKEVRLFVVAPGRDLARGSLHDDAPVELRQRRDLLRWHSIVDERLHGIDVGGWEVVLVEGAGGDYPFPGPDVVPQQERLGRLVRFAVGVDDELRGLPGLAGPTLDDVGFTLRGHGDSFGWGFLHELPRRPSGNRRRPGASL